MSPERKILVRALTAHPANLIHELAEELSADFELKIINIPQAGLGLLKLNDGAFHEPYYLGEFPLSTCSVEISLADGSRGVGGARVMEDDAELAQALAILDAILANGFPGHAKITELIHKGMDKRNEEDRRRRMMLAATKVDFDLLNSAGKKENDDED